VDRWLVATRWRSWVVGAACGEWALASETGRGSARNPASSATAGSSEVVTSQRHELAITLTGIPSYAKPYFHEATVDDWRTQPWDAG
jgi:hypothetical protein